MAEVQTRFRFESTALDKDIFRVVSFTGEETISQPYRYEIELLSEDPDIDIDTVLAKRATLTMYRDNAERFVHGVISEFEAGHQLPNHLYRYRAVLVPRLWLLSLSKQNQIYQEQSIPSIIKEELLETSLKNVEGLANTGISADYFEFRLSDYPADASSSKNFPLREYVVQYKESDLNFISRLMEHEGMFYFFEQGNDSEKLVITDHNASLPDFGETKLDYQTPTGMVSHDKPSVFRFLTKKQQLTKQVLLKDYNYRKPDLPQEGRETIYDNGIGFIAEYGAHFKTPEEGQRYAKLRAEEIFCQQHTFQGDSDYIQLSPGYIFGMDGHHRDSFNRNYLVTRITHTGEDPNMKSAGTGDAGTAKSTYSNSFACQPNDVQFRPQRITEKPKLYGILNATIDSSNDGKRAEIDDQGRYKVIMPFDISGAGEGKASRYIRLSTPYTGSNQGMHFPLLKGTEVIWTCIDGDIDRPIIVGTVPNPLNKSVVNSENKTSNVIRTPSGISMRFNDGSGDDSQQGNTQSNDGSLNKQQQKQKQKQSLMRFPTNTKQSDATQNSSIPNQQTTTQSNTQELAQQQHHSQLTITDTQHVGKDIWEGDTNFQITVPWSGNTNYTYLRMGQKCSDEAYGGGDLSLTNNSLSGHFEYTDGNRTIITTGSKEEVIHGQSRLSISTGSAVLSDAQKMYDVKWVNLSRGANETPQSGDEWHKYESQYISETVASCGSTESIFGGYQYDAFGGLKTDIALAGQISVDMTPEVNVALGADIKYGANWEYDFVAGDRYSSVGSEKIKAKDYIELKVKTDPSSGKHKIIGTGIALAGAGIAGVTAAIGAATKPDSPGAANALKHIGWIVPSVAYIAAIATTIIHFKTKEHGDDKARILLGKKKPTEDERIEMTCGKSSLLLNSDGTIELCSKDANGKVVAGLSLDADGIVTLLNQKGVLQIDDEQAALGHVTAVGMAKSTVDTSDDFPSFDPDGTATIVADATDITIEHSTKVEVNSQTFDP